LAVAGSPHGLEFTVVRLPRVVGEGHQLRDTADVLVSVVDACIASGAYPTLTLTEEVTTARAAARAILGLLPESAGPAEPGRGITVVHGEQVSYTELLGGYALDELEVTEWKRRLDQSNWARMNPRRWSVVDAWVSLGMQLGGAVTPSTLPRLRPSRSDSTTSPSFPRAHRRSGRCWRKTF
jgi:thioester reductase-like protein